MKVIANSNQEKITTRADGLIKVKVQPPAEKGKANRRTKELIAEKYNTKPRNIVIVKGKTNPLKVIKIIK